MSHESSPGSSRRDVVCLSRRVGERGRPYWRTVTSALPSIISMELPVLTPAPNPPSSPHVAAVRRLFPPIRSAGILFLQMTGWNLCQNCRLHRPCHFFQAPPLNQGLSRLVIQSPSICRQSDPYPGPLYHWSRLIASCLPSIPRDIRQPDSTNITSFRLEIRPP